DDLMMRYSSSPSFCILTLINESWGIDLSQFDENKWLFDFWKESKLCIRDRLIVDNSACLGNHHVSSDLNDFHFYHAYPEKEAEWNETVKAFAENSFLPFKAVDDSEKVCRPETLPKIISEFGVWSLSDPVLWQGKWIDYENMSYQVRDFMKSTVDGFYNSSALFKGVQWQAFYALKHQIEEMRIYPEISGFVLTELSDISWEANGILDYSRNDKPFTQYMKMLNQDLLPILRKNGEIYISNISNTPIEGEISVTCEGDVLYAGSFKSLPNSCTKVSDCEIEGINGMVTLEFITVDNRSFVNFRNLYAGRKETCFYIADQLDDESYKTAEKGERVYIHLNKPGNFEGFDVIPAKTPLGAIAGMNFDGDWISGFYYYHPELLGYLNYENGSEELCGSFRDTVIVNTKEYDVLIGKMIGWNLAPCACVIRKRVGRGEIIISTLDLEATQKLYLLG
ncbi:MAG TPA: hypothetical protein PK466_14300, partial [Thermotogota bacterium]|nr:hypothetical protein [Thermotogota bacterium]